MSDQQPLKPEDVPMVQLTEAEETKVLNWLEQHIQNCDPRTSITKTMVDLKAGLLEKGMSEAVIHKIIGKITYVVPASVYGSLFYQKHLEIVVENIVRIYELFMKDFNEDVFVDVMKDMKFIVQFPHYYLALIEEIERQKGEDAE